MLTQPALKFRRQKVIVREWLDGRLSIRFKGKELEYKEVDKVQPKPVVKVIALKGWRRLPK